MKFLQMLAKARKSRLILPKRLLCLDPGSTTGWSLFEEGVPVEGGQITNVADGQCLYQSMLDLFAQTKPTRVVCENYRLYQHKLEAQSFSEVHTVRIIGFIEAICQLGLTTDGQAIPLYFQMAQEAKGFCTDSKLKLWGFWVKGMRHNRDAIRHGCYWLLFNKLTKGDDKLDVPAVCQE